MPVLSRRMGRLWPVFRCAGLIRLASVNSVITKPSSAISSSDLRSSTSSVADAGRRMVAAPAAVNSIGAVMKVFSSRRDTRL